MKWSITQLRKFQDKPFEFHQTVNFDHLVKSLDLIDLSDIDVEGELTVKSNEVVADMHITGEYTMEDARTLEPVKVPIDVETTEIFDLEGHEYSDDEDDENENYHLALSGMIDLRDIAEELVIIEKPIRAVADDSSFDDMLQEGQGWEVIDEDQLEQNEQADEGSKKVDPRLQKLQQFYDEKQ